MIDCKFSHVDSKGLKNRKAGALGLLKELARKIKFFSVNEYQLFGNMHRINILKAKLASIVGNLDLERVWIYGIQNVRSSFL